MPIAQVTSHPVMYALNSSEPLAPRSWATARGGRSDHRADVADRRPVRIVEVQGVRRHAVDEGGSGRRKPPVAPERGCLRNAALRGEHARGGGLLAHPDRGKCAAEDVDEVLAGGDLDGDGDVVLRGDGKGGQAAGRGTRTAGDQATTAT